MDEKTVHNRITDAMQAPSPPEALVQRTVQRVSAIVMGRHAEQRLETAGADLGRTEQAQLAALGLIGRLAMVSPLPEGAEPAEMARQLAENPRFIRAAENGDVLQRLRSGELLQETLRPEPVKQEAPEPPQPQREGPAL